MDKYIPKYNFSDLLDVYVPIGKSEYPSIAFGGVKSVTKQVNELIRLWTDKDESVPDIIRWSYNVCSGPGEYNKNKTPYSIYESYIKKKSETHQDCSPLDFAKKHPTEKRYGLCTCIVLNSDHKFKLFIYTPGTDKFAKLYENSLNWPICKDCYKQIRFIYKSEIDFTQKSKPIEIVEVDDVDDDEFPDCIIDKNTIGTNKCGGIVRPSNSGKNQFDNLIANDLNNEDSEINELFGFDPSSKINVCTGIPSHKTEGKYPFIYLLYMFKMFKNFI